MGIAFLKTTRLIAACTLISYILLAGSVNAGVLTSIAKIASKIDAPSAKLAKLPEGSLQQLNLVLPDGIKPNVLHAKLNAKGEWMLRDPQGNMISEGAKIENVALVISKADLPRDLNKFDTLPANTPILIRSNQSVFELKRQRGWALKAGGAGIKVKDFAQLQFAIAHFERPWASGPVRILGLKDLAANSLSLRRGVDSKTLTNTPQQLRGQTVAVAGRIDGDRIKTATGNFSIRELRSDAEQYDISLLIIDGAKPFSPKALLKRLDTNMVDGVPQNTGQFLAGLHDPNATTFYKIASTGKQQVLINQIVSSPAKAATNPDLTDLLLARGALAASRIAILRPNEERANELDNRLVYWLPSWVHIYLIISTILGLIAIKTSSNLFDRVWVWQSKPKTIARKIETGPRLVMLGLVFIPVFGAPIATYRLTRIFLSAIKWAFTMLINLLVLLCLPFIKAWKRLRATDSA